MAAYCSLLLNEQKDQLPPNYDVDTACECMHWACGRAYQTPIGRAVHPFIVHPRGIAMCEIRAEKLLVVFRGTVAKMLNELSRNILGCGMDPTRAHAPRAAPCWEARGGGGDGMVNGGMCGWVMEKIVRLAWEGHRLHLLRTRHRSRRRSRLRPRLLRPPRLPRAHRPVTRLPYLPRR